jgi:biotin synthase
MIATLASLPAHPESVPINCWCRSKALRLSDRANSIRSILCAPSRSRGIAMPASMVRLSAGREGMSEETQALCFLAGANSIFYGPKLLTTPNPGRDRDMALLDRLGLRPME